MNANKWTFLFVAVFAFFSMFISSVAQIALFSILIYSIFSGYYRKIDRNIMILFALSLSFLLLNVYIGIEGFPETRKLQWKEFTRIILFWAVFPLSFFISKKIAKINLILILSLCGFVLGIITCGDFVEIIVSMKRTGFHLRPVSFSLYAGMFLLGIFVFFEDFISEILKKPIWQRSFLFFVFSFVLLVITFSFFVSQSRSGFIALAVSLGAAVVLKLIYKKRIFPVQGKKLLVGVTCLLFLAVFIYTYQAFSSRFSGEWNTFSDQLTSTGSQFVPNTSIGYRTKIYEYGLKILWEKPFLGWGGGSTQQVMARSGDEVLRMETGNWYDHFHNFLIESMVRYGFIGCLLIAGYLALVFSGYKKILKRPTIGNHVIFFVTGLLMIAIWSMFDYRHNHYDWRFFWLVFAGTAMAYAEGSHEPSADN